jgi:hypothetical protein
MPTYIAAGKEICGEILDAVQVSSLSVDVITGSR